MCHLKNTLTPICGWKKRRKKKTNETILIWVDIKKYIENVCAKNQTDIQTRQQLYLQTHTHTLFFPFKMRTNNTGLQSSRKSIQLVKAIRKEKLGKYKIFFNKSPTKVYSLLRKQAFSADFSILILFSDGSPIASKQSRYIQYMRIGKPKSYDLYLVHELIENYT